MFATLRRRLKVAIVVAPGLALAGVPLLATEAQAAETGTVYLVQGVADSAMTITVDDKVVATGAAAKSIVGPLTLPAGNHTVKAESPTNAGQVTATMSLASGANVDAVIHRQVDPSKPPLITVFPNDLSAVAAGSGRLVVAHTAAVGPADILVNGKVAFSNIANGEALTATVPAASYEVKIVPSATTGPVVFGPADVPVAAEKLNRVFAIGVAATNSMDAIVQVLPLGVRGAGTTPSTVNAGDGGQAAGLFATEQPASAPYGLVVLLVVGLTTFAVAARRHAMRRRSSIS